MTDYELCYMVMVILYLMECCLPLPENSVLFTRGIRRWRVNRSPGCAFTTGKRLVLINPLPFAEEWHVAPLPGATYTDQGIITLNSLHDYPQGFAAPQTLRPDSPAGAYWLQILAAAGYQAGGGQETAPQPDPPADGQEITRPPGHPAGDQKTAPEPDPPADGQEITQQPGTPADGQEITLPPDHPAGGQETAPPSVPPAAETFGHIPLASPDPGLARWTDPGLVGWTNSLPVRERYQRLRSGLVFLNLLCVLQFCWAFVAAPLLLSWFSLERMVLPFLFVLFWLGGCVAVSFAALHRRVHGRGWIALGKALWLFLYPMAAMRAVQNICGGSLPPCHESALAYVLLRRKTSGTSEAKEFAAQNEAAMQYLFDITIKLKYRLFCRSLSAADSQALAKANERLLQAVYANWDVHAPALPRDPAAMDAAMACHCPVCGLEMTVAMEYCPQCLEVRTVARQGL